jgi:hypothetical protein
MAPKGRNEVENAAGYWSVSLARTDFGLHVHAAEEDGWCAHLVGRLLHVNRGHAKKVLVYRCM